MNNIVSSRQSLEAMVKEHGENVPLLVAAHRECKKLELLAATATALLTILSLSLFVIALSGYRLARVDEIETTSLPSQHIQHATYSASRLGRWHNAQASNVIGF